MVQSIDVFKNREKVHIPLCVKHMGALMLLLFIKSSMISLYAQSSQRIVPYPKQVELGAEKIAFKEVVSVSYDNAIFVPLTQLLKEDLRKLFQLSVIQVDKEADIRILYKEGLPEEGYQISIKESVIRIYAGSYDAACMGVTTLVQLGQPDASTQTIILPELQISDWPSYSYRGVSLDVARKWHHVETIKQVVTLCRWYKIKYLQLHLSDDQLFTFPSKAFPTLASKQQYTIQQLQELVEFAKLNGVIIIPELDAPGHTSAMRTTMPALFGKPEWGVLDMTSKKVYQAMDTLIKEMIDIFYTSPYFHIGADEAWLGAFEKLPQVKKYIQEKGFDNVHDVYLDFVVAMQKIVKKYHRQPLVWESFSGTGSRKVHIPKDLIVFAWETAYQRPDSLLKHGYKIINASWKPAYITPGLRWDPEYIYHWNLYRWENQWYTTPSYISPIQLDSSSEVLGGQLCAWEMSEDQTVPSLRSRMAAMSEILWNGRGRRPYSNFKKRYDLVNEKANLLLFPVRIKKVGFRGADDNLHNDNRENSFEDQVSVSFEPIL